MDIDNIGIIKQHSQITWSTENNGGNNKNADNA